jgi:hypothetical protein
MNCRKAILGTCIFAFTLSLGALASRAQDEPQPVPDTPPQPMPDSPPKAAGRSFPGIPGIEIGKQEGELQPDFSPLTGMQNATLGYPEISHSYWVPGIQFSSNLQSKPYGQSGGSNWYADNYFIGNLSLLEAWSRATFAVNYSGGGYVSTDSTRGNGFSQQLALAQNFRTERWLIQIVDQFSYLPQTSFGFGGGTNLGIPGVGGSLGTTIPGLGGNYIPNQSVYGGFGAVYSNAAALQATYALSRRGSVTVSGSYGILSFVAAGNFDSNNTVGSIGYNYALSRNDTVGLVYRFSAYHFPGNPQAYGDNVMSVAYGRKLTGRLALRLFVGPEVTNYRIPIGTATRKTGVSTTASLTYGFPRGGFSLGYIYGLSGGSGVLIGSILDQGTATAYRKLTRVWTGNVNFGYGRNSMIGGSSLFSRPTYDSWFAGGGVSRPIGRNFNFGLAYTANIASVSQAGCTGTGCSPTNTYQIVTVNFQWHPRPFVLP